MQWLLLDCFHMFKKWEMFHKIFDQTHKIKIKDEYVQGMDEMRDGDNDERNVTDEIGSSSGAAEGQEVF